VFLLFVPASLRVHAMGDCVLNFAGHRLHLKR
jgi:hypothetical protein